MLNWGNKWRGTDTDSEGRLCQNWLPAFWTGGGVPLYKEGPCFLNMPERKKEDTKLSSIGRKGRMSTEHIKSPLVQFETEWITLTIAHCAKINQNQTEIQKIYLFRVVHRVTGQSWPHQAKTCLRICAKCVFRLSCACAKYQPCLFSPSIHSVISNDSDQTARMRRLIWTLAVHTRPKARFRIARPI